MTGSFFLPFRNRAKHSLRSGNSSNELHSRCDFVLARLCGLWTRHYAAFVLRRDWTLGSHIVRVVALVTQVSSVVRDGWGPGTWGTQMTMGKKNSQAKPSIDQSATLRSPRRRCPLIEATDRQVPFQPHSLVPPPSLIHFLGGGC